MELRTSGFARVLILSLTIGFFKFGPPNLFFLSKFGPETQKCFALNETWYSEVFKGANLEFDNCFLKFDPRNTSFGQIWFRNITLLSFKLNLAHRDIQVC